jgi:hypothetical protein
MAAKSKLKEHLFLDEFGEAPIFKIKVTSVPETPFASSRPADPRIKSVSYFLRSCVIRSYVV